MTAVSPWEHAAVFYVMERWPVRQLVILKVPASLENVPAVIDRVTSAARAAGVDSRMLYQIQLVVDEACANVVEHAYQGMAQGDLEVTCCLDANGLSVEVRDWGKGFVPECVPEPDVEAPLQERNLGGLGLFLIKQMMDEVQYTMDPDLGNTLTMVKKLPGAAETLCTSGSHEG
jgi:serine/threonine-protein kinase RsbW